MLNNKPDRVSSKSPFYLLFIGLSLLIIFMSILYYRAEVRKVRTEKHDELNAIAKLKTNQITSWIRERKSDALVVASSPFFTQAINNWMANSNDPDLRKQIINRLKIAQTQHDYTEIILTTPQGKLLLAINPQQAPLDPITKHKIIAACQTGTVQFTDFYYCSHDNRIYLDFIISILDIRQKPIAALILRIAPENYLYPLIQEWPTPYKTAETLLIRQEGDSVLFLNNLRHLPNSALHLRVAISDTSVPAVQAVLGRTGIFEGRDYRGARVLTHLGAVPQTNWFMVTKVDEAEIYADLNHRLRFILLIMVILLATIGAGMASIYNRRQYTVYRALFNEEKERYALEEEFYTTLYSIGDAVITTDRAGSVKFLNPVAEELTGWKEKDARGKTLAEVFNIINEETRQMVPNPVQKVLKEGLVVGLANHTLLISKDRREIPITDSGAPIKDENGEIFGVVLVFRDISQNRQAEEQIRYQANLLQNVSDAVIATDENSLITSWNPAAEMMYGWKADEVIGKKFHDIISPEYPYESRDTVFEKINKDGTWSGEIVHHVKNRKPLTVLSTISFLKNISGNKTGLVSINHDITEKKLLEEQILQSELQFRSVWEKSQDGMRLTDEKGTIVRVNDAFCRIMGVSRSEVEGQSLAVIYTEARRKHIEKMHRERFRTRTIKPYSEQAVILRDGREIWVEVMNSFFESSKDNPLLLGIFRDITNRKLAENALRESELKYRSLVDQSLLGILIVQNRRLMYANNFILERSGYNLEELSGLRPMQLMKLIHPDDRKVVWTRMLNRFLGKKEPARNECRFIAKDGSIYWADVHTNVIEYLGKTAIQLCIVDTTERKQSEKALEESETLFRTLAENSPAAVFIYQDEYFVYVNKVTENLIGHSAVEMYQTRFWDVVHPDFRELVHERGLARQRGEQIPIHYEFKILHANGTERWVDFAGGRILYKDKPAAIGFAYDITDRKQAEEALKKSEEQLRQTQKLEALGQLASGIAHDFNNILAIIMGHATLLKMGQLDPDRHQHSIDTIEKTSQRAADLVKQLLTLARRNEPLIGPLDLNELLADTTKMLSETFPKVITFQTEIQPSLPFILADESQINQVIMNLCVNARDAMPQGGILMVAARRVSGAMLRQRQTDALAAQYIEICVGDTGIGMDQATLDRIFEPFFTTKGPGKGTGLGLATVHGIVTNHHGFIEVESKPGAGTKISVFLPTPKSSEKTDSAEAEEFQELMGGDETILIIEDEELITDMLSSVLIDKGYRILIARNGLEGVEVYTREKDKIALVLTDMGLPKLTGDAVFHRIREINPQARVIIASGFLSPDEKSELYKAGLAMFIQKPYMPLDVLKAFREVLDT
ncbi:MAG: PAS domain S-box protein [Candidatus Neomarinimicrobiota bacterium]